MARAQTLTPLFEGGSYFECPRWHDGRWWVSDFYRRAVFGFDIMGGGQPTPIDVRDTAIGCRTFRGHSPDSVRRRAGRRVGLD